jgi:16S rRNA (cytosine1402-N4)-methyltransferase
MPGRAAARAARFTPVFKGHRQPDVAEMARNPRARSAKLRAGERTEAQALPLDLADIAVPQLEGPHR